MQAIKLLVIFASVVLLAACLSQPRTTVPTPPATEQFSAKKEITIALLGATGMVGGYILEEALSRGYDIRALSRSPHKLEGFKDQISIIQGNARDPAAIDSLLRGSHIVISALGPVKADGKAANMISTTASTLVTQAMTAHDIRRYIVVSGAAVTVPGDNRSLTGWWVKQLGSLVFRNTLKDKQAEYRLLSDSSVDWTLVRCPLIVPEPFDQGAVVSRETPTSFRLRAGDLARFILDEVDSEDYVREAPFLGSR